MLVRWYLTSVITRKGDLISILSESSYYTETGQVVHHDPYSLQLTFNILFIHVLQLIGRLMFMLTIMTLEGVSGLFLSKQLMLPDRETVSILSPCHRHPSCISFKFEPRLNSLLNITQSMININSHSQHDRACIHCDIRTF